MLMGKCSITLFCRLLLWRFATSADMAFVRHKKTHQSLIWLLIIIIAHLEWKKSSVWNKFCFYRRETLPSRLKGNTTSSNRGSTAFLRFLTLVTFSEERYFLTMWDKKFYLKVVEKLGFRAQFSKTVPEQPNYYSTGICSIFPCHANVKCAHKIIIAYCIISWKNMLPIF